LLFQHKWHAVLFICTLDEAVHPPHVHRVLTEMGYRLHVDTSIKSTPNQSHPCLMAGAGGKKHTRTHSKVMLRAILSDLENVRMTMKIMPLAASMTLVLLAKSPE